MHIKLVVNSFPSASETFLFNLVTGLEARGQEITVCTLSRNNNLDLYANRLHEWSGRIEHIPLRIEGPSSFASALRILITDLSLLRSCIKSLGLKKGTKTAIQTSALLSGNPDIVHFAYSGIGLTFSEAIEQIKKRGVRIFLSCRGTAEKVKPVTDPRRQQLLKGLFRSVDRVHCVSSDMLKGLKKIGLPEEKSFVNFPSINLETFTRDRPYDAQSKAKWEFLTTGRLHYQKGYIFALLALRRLRSKGVDFTYNILGDGPDWEMLTYLISDLGLSDCVVLRGKVGSEEVKRFLNRADVFILPSIYEGIANAVLEAMAMEIPVVSTTAGGMSEVLVHRVNGMLLEPFDEVLIADAIEELLVSDDLRMTIGRNGKNTILDRFDLNSQIDIFIREYEQVARAV